MNNTTNGIISIESAVIFGFATFELLVNLFGVPISAVNFTLISRTSIIHRNLKFILLYQSATIFMRALCRFIICAIKFIILDPLISETMQPMRFTYTLCLNNRNVCAHILIIERVLATLFVASYENRAKWAFPLVWMPIVFGASLYNTLTSSSLFGLLITNHTLLALALLEVSLFAWLWNYNTKAYNNGANTSEHNLSKRYQLSENIRIGKQLIPALLFHFCNIMSSNLITNWSYFGAPGVNIVLVFTATFSSFCSLMIEITMIIYHPFLKRDFLGFLMRILRGCRSNRVNSVEDGQEEYAIALRDINGKELLNVNGQNDYFVLLKQQWEK